MATKKTAVAEFDPKNPNAVLNLDFDYNNLTGEEFKRYNELLESLCPVLGIKEHTFKSFDFELYRAKPIFKERFPGLPNTPRDFIGIELIEDKQPLFKTRITIRNARDLNSQIINANHNSRWGKYYLLKKD
jgi:hypothetical protein